MRKRTGLRKTLTGAQMLEYMKRVAPFDDLPDYDVGHWVFALRRNYPLSRLKFTNLMEHARDVGEDRIAVVRDYAGLTTRPPPVLATKNGYMIDGNHRCTAAALAGRRTIDAYVADHDPE